MLYRGLIRPRLEFAAAFTSSWKVLQPPTAMLCTAHDFHPGSCHIRHIVPIKHTLSPPKSKPYWNTTLQLTSHGPKLWPACEWTHKLELPSAWNSCNMLGGLQKQHCYFLYISGMFTIQSQCSFDPHRWANGYHICSPCSTGPRSLSV